MDNAAQFEDALAPYIAAANPMNTRRASLSTVRAWARARGYPVARQGRIHAEIMAAYEAAHR